MIWLAVKTQRAQKLTRFNPNLSFNHLWVSHKPRAAHDSLSVTSSSLSFVEAAFWRLPLLSSPLHTAAFVIISYGIVLLFEKLRVYKILCTIRSDKSASHSPTNPCFSIPLPYNHFLKYLHRLLIKLIQTENNSSCVKTGAIGAYASWEIWIIDPPLRVVYANWDLEENWGTPHYYHFIY